ncbi:MAG: V-type ATP synthase subunit A [Clostridia bacterium]|nr:V-type ATP synthase subunit A [Clostridia bacterium]
MEESVILRVSGPVVKVRGASSFKMHETVMVGSKKLIGEVIGLDNDIATVQVYEVTTGLTAGEPVAPTGKPLSVWLGPGIIGNIFDGIERPLKAVEKKTGAFIPRGVSTEFDEEGRKWKVEIFVKPGDKVCQGMVVAQTRETPLIMHKIMVPPGIEGIVSEVMPEGEYTVYDTIIRISAGPNRTFEMKMLQEWPVRKARPSLERLAVNEPLITGQRIIDTFFPIGKGGTAAIPGSFGTGKTMTQHQLAKWSDADIIVYIGCGERGNEMTEVLEDFPKLMDPKSGRPLMERTVLIANTSNMPVAAREASIYTGITLAEYYRDMGYNIAIMADSTSRWAEALREISGRLEEMPAEEGFPAYLSSRLSEFYERAGRFKTLGNSIGSITVIGAVSPQGGDFSEPVTQNTKRFIRCFWALDRQLAYARHYPAIHWLLSYSEYMEALSGWYEDKVNPLFMKHRSELLKILQEESKLLEIVKLVGSDILPDEQKLTLETGRTIRLGFLQQAAFHPVDTYVSLEKQFYMMDIILFLHKEAYELIRKGIPASHVKETGYFEDIIKAKYTVSNEELHIFQEMKARFREGLEKLK